MIEKEQISKIAQKYFDHNFPLRKISIETLELISTLNKVMVKWYTGKNAQSVIEKRATSLSKKENIARTAKDTFYLRPYVSEITTMAVFDVAAHSFQCIVKLAKELEQYRQEAISNTITYLSMEEGVDRNPFHTNALTCIEKYLETYNTFYKQGATRALFQALNEFHETTPDSKIVKNTILQSDANPLCQASCHHLI